MIPRGMSAWGDIQSFDGKRQDGGFGPIGSNRGGAPPWIRGSGRVASIRFIDSLGHPPVKLSCLSGSGLRVPQGLCREPISSNESLCDIFSEKILKEILAICKYLKYVTVNNQYSSKN